MPIDLDENIRLTKVQQAYEAALEKMGPQGRVRRCMELYESMYQMLRQQLLNENASLDERAIRFKIAEKMYQSQPQALAIIHKAQQHEL